MNIIFHFLINIILALPFKLTIFEIFLIGLGGVLIDIDHVFYMIFKERRYSIKRMFKFHQRENAIKRPHFYLFHFIEIILILVLFGYFTNWYLFLIFIGFGLHWIFDVVSYIVMYKAFKPWINYLSIILYYLKIKR